MLDTVVWWIMGLVALVMAGLLNYWAKSISESTASLKNEIHSLREEVAHLTREFGQYQIAQAQVITALVTKVDCERYRDRGHCGGSRRDDNTA